MDSTKIRKYCVKNNIPIRTTYESKYNMVVINCDVTKDTILNNKKFDKGIRFFNRYFPIDKTQAPYYDGLTYVMHSKTEFQTLFAQLDKNGFVEKSFKYQVKGKGNDYLFENDDISIQIVELYDLHIYNFTFYPKE